MYFVKYVIFVFLLQDNLLFCDSCDRGFHMDCCTPRLFHMPKGIVRILSVDMRYIIEQMKQEFQYNSSTWVVA